MGTGVAPLLWAAGIFLLHHEDTEITERQLQIAILRALRGEKELNSGSGQTLFGPDGFGPSAVRNAVKPIGRLVPVS